MIRFAFATCLLLSATSVLNADLVLQVNPVDKTFALTGSDIVTPEMGGSGDPTFGWWSGTIDPSIGTSTSSILFDNDVAFTTNVGTPGSGGYDTLLTFNDKSINLFLRTSTLSEQTITGTGVPQSYTGLTAIAETKLEALDGTAWVPALGSGQQSLSISTVPEPSAFACLGLIGLVTLGRSWSKRRRGVRAAMAT